MSTHANNNTKPHEKMPEHHSTDKQPKNKEEKIDIGKHIIACVRVRAPHSSPQM